MRIPPPVDGAEIIDVAGGYRSSALVTADGRLYTAGKGDGGLLGHERGGEGRPINTDQGDEYCESFRHVEWSGPGGYQVVSFSIHNCDTFPIKQVF